ncbi:MAG: preprotein translocase subunit SecE [Candidatus Colwellbacteria bacterium]|nr:preprotein translocase subunit SecE [Candidatus Colwellbacteria bacterium]
MFGSFLSFLKESREELKRVVWPTRRATLRMVLIVVLLSLTVAFFLGAMDFVFLYLLEKVVI